MGQLPEYSLMSAYFNNQPEVLEGLLDDRCREGGVPCQPHQLLQHFLQVWVKQVWLLLLMTFSEQGQFIMGHI